MLKKFTSNEVDKWDKYLPYLLFAHREVPCQSTGYSPFKLLYSRTGRGPLSLITEAWIGKEALEKNTISYVLETRRRLSEMQNIVRQITNKSHKI